MKHLERLPRELSLEESNGNGARANESAVNRFTPVHWAEQQERSERVRRRYWICGEFREAVVLCELEELSYEEAAH